MRALSSSDFLDLWERGSGLHALDRGLLALSAAFPEVEQTSFADWTLGHRNQALIDLHCRLFGSALECWATCTRCGEKMEFEINGRALIDKNVGEISGEQTVSFKNQCFRLPTSRDLAGAMQSKDHEAGALWLIEHCRTNATEAVYWTEEELEQVGEEMAKADPMAEIPISLDCPKCGNPSNETVEIASFLWSKIEARARRLLWEIHAIASAYGWTESEILSLRPTRRALYLQMVQA